MQTATDTPRIYVACLAAYNSGKLHGEWIDASQTAEDIHAAIKAMLKASPEPNAEEWAIHDTDNFWGLNVQEFGLSDIAKLAEAVEEHGEAYAAWVGVVGLKYADVDSFQDAYVGEYDSFKSYCEAVAEDFLDKEALLAHFWHGGIDSFVREMEMEHSIADSAGGVFIFRDC